MARIGRIALIPTLALGRMPSPLRAAEIAVHPPTSPMRLRRVVERDLADGKLLIVTRDWQCEFVRESEDITVSGRQVAVEVDAPPALAPLSAIEKNRVDEGLFPARLDLTGQIVSMNTAQDDTAIRKGVDVARTIFASMPPGPLDGADPEAFMVQLIGTSAQAISRVPRDLFYPVAGEWTETRSVDLGDTQGEIEIRVLTTTRPDGLLERTERAVRTRYGGRDRHSRECQFCRKARQLSN
ncbi:hypothetical protein [Qipengyuania spongiae]|uniref:DUF2382 domain-containing protein n=1 Tax=Qipengyuania spongiae TaxID=2909673 RepID=A0ABY5SZF5_9SPHN|nr:hypothetical protein [Qipengyuania spongiae]UVI39917.1 hypothetical protein L1F33_02860 [Qipengyuania spongiae]